ncbi:MAG: LytTR family DNA-binding domain-containing protein [Rikenellaceae bacterium]
MRVVIIEDEVAALEQLSALLTSNNQYDIEIVETIDSIEDSIDFFKSDKSDDIDLIFMDIHLSDGYAFTIFKHVEVSKPIIFTTAYDEYALKSFEVNCIDYLLKPISKSDIERIFTKIKTLSEHVNMLPNIADTKTTDTILVVDSWYTVPLKFKEIAYFYKDGSRVKAFDFNGRSYQVNTVLEKLELLLDSKEFVRANRQFILARSAVKSVESYLGSRAIVNLFQSTPEQIIISRTKVTSFKRWLISED